MDAYSPAFAPAAFGLINTGVICYINAFLQALAGCTAFTRAVLDNAAYLGATRTGAAVLAFVRAYAAPAGAHAHAAPGAPQHSAAVLAALAADLAERRPAVRFGARQECASEALVHLLDMLEPPAPPGAPPEESPVTRLFSHRFRCDLRCCGCKQTVSAETDTSVVFNLFHLDQQHPWPDTPAAFSKAVRLHVSVSEGYACPNCQRATQAFRVYNLSMVPELILCVFNLFDLWGGGARRARYFPPGLEFPALDGGKLVFRLVGQVEHAGSQEGGHYWARGLRAGGQVFLLNDTSAVPSAFAPSSNTFLVAYHYEGHEPPAVAVVRAGVGR
jgi:ubiquitin C-terminal hydrolase